MGGQNNGGAFIVEIFQEAPHGATKFDIDTRSRLIEDQQLWLVHQRTGNHQAALHPAGQHARAFVTLFPQIELLKVFFATLQGLFTLNAVIARLVNHDLLHRLERVEVELLRYQPQLAFGVHHIFLQVVPKDAHPAGRFIDQRADNPNGGRFPRPVRPQKRVKITGLYFKIYSA